MPVHRFEIDCRGPGQSRIHPLDIAKLVIANISVKRPDQASMQPVFRRSIDF
jgi:hypothetical protein